MFTKRFKELSNVVLKDKTRVLFIDDESRKDIIDYLFEEGWNSRQLADKDMKAIDNKDISDSHIICVDINGVGTHMKKEHEGLDIAASIKKRYPQKKVILYSSQATHNIFHEANTLVDRRIHKSSGDYEIFRNEIESLSKELFNWETMTFYSYNLVKEQLSSDITYDKYKKILLKSIKQKKYDTDSISGLLSLGVKTAEIVSLIIKVFTLVP